MRILIYLSALFIISSSLASELKCSLRGTEIHFVNGVKNTPENVENSVEVLEYALENFSAFDRIGILEFGSTYNHSHGYIEDFLESGSQKIHSHAKDLGITVSIEEGFVLLFRLINTGVSSLPPYFWPLKIFIQNYLSDIDTRVNIEQTDVDTLRGNIRDILKKDLKLILISHS